jgi:hypothetical protein
LEPDEETNAERCLAMFHCVRKTVVGPRLVEVEVGLDLAMARLSKLFLALPPVQLATAPLSFHIL